MADEEESSLPPNMATSSFNGKSDTSIGNSSDGINNNKGRTESSESSQPHSVTFTTDHVRKQSVRGGGQKKLGPLDRKRQRNASLKINHSIRDKRTFRESSQKKTSHNGLKQDVTKETGQKTKKRFFSWKKGGESKDNGDLHLVNLDTIFSHTNLSWLWRDECCGVNKLDENGLALLHVAAQSNDVELIEELIQKGADINIKSSVDEATPLHIASKYNCANATEVLLLHGADVTDALTNGQTALHVCCRRGHLMLIKILVEKGKSDVNSRDKDKTTPLHQAMINGELEIFTYLVENGADICAKDINNETPLMLAAQGGFLEIVQYFLTIASQQGIGILDYLSLTDNEGSSALHLAVGSRNLVVAKFLIDRGAPVNCQKVSNGFAALHQAAVLGDPSLVQMLIDKGAQTEICDKEQMTPLHRAALYNRVDTILILIRQGLFLDARDEDDFTPLICAAWKGQVDAGRSLLRYGADIKVVDKEMKTCLHWAVETQHEKFVEMLFEHGHDGELLIEQQDRRERTPLHYAAEVGNVQLVKFLIEHGAKVDRKNAEEKSSLHVASESGNLDCVMELLDACPVPLNDDDIDDMTPLLLASQNGHHHVVKYLIKMGADIESRNDDRRSALALAAQNNQLEVLAFLIENNAEVNVLDKDRNTPLHLCAYVGHSEPVTILLNSGADVTLPNKYGKYALDVAIERKQEDVAKAILSSKCWEKAMHNYDANGLSPMKKLIEVLPDAAVQVMDQCVTKSHDDNIDPELQVTYDYRFVDPGPDDISYEKNNCRYFALETMVEYRRETLLAHELSQNILARKWKKYAALCNYCDLLMYLTFLVSNIIYLDRLGDLKPLFQMSESDQSGCPVFNSTNLNRSIFMLKETDIGFDLSGVYIRDYYLIGMQIYILMFIIYRIIRELPQIFRQPIAYVRTMESWLKWTLYVTVFNFIYPPAELPCDSNWAWGALAVFVTWMNFIFILQRFDFFGLYVAMFFTTLKSLLKAMVVYVFFIIGFGLAFYICFERTNPSFRGEWEAIITTFVMTLGEINKGDLLDSGESLYPFELVANILVVTFLFLMPMVLINLTVDIIFGFEKKFPLWLQRKVWSAGGIYTPNKPKNSCLEKVSRFILGSATNANFLSKKVDNEAAKPATVDDVLQEISRHETILNSLSTMMYQQGELLHRLAESQGITSGLGVTPSMRTSSSLRMGNREGSQ
ncbi:transient receptor potential cation channel subfamily A member 1-like isoform X2 [Amphiura filiformis]|uniref:transient receptor potential cation channel subfamily A member 1-like isoform X2 n=1 Tax=Amphiura filiformis TaxID=82378 RepID=UPI003B21F58C